MREVFSNLYCGSQSDYEEIDRDCLKNKTTGNFVMWAIVHACKNRITEHLSATLAVAAQKIHLNICGQNVETGWH